MKIAFYDAHQYDIKYFSEANKDFNYQIDFFDFRLNEKTSDSADGYDCVCVFINDTLNKDVLIKLSLYGIKLIVLRCAGYNNINLEEAEKLQITVLRVPDYSPHAIAEHGISLLLALLRKIPQSYIRTKSGNFSQDGLIGKNLFGKTAGIIGTGRIGRVMAEILKGFGMNILLHDINPSEKWAQDNKFEYVSLRDLFSKSDIISLHCPLTKTTRHIINNGSLSLVKPDCILLNTSRGGLIDTDALVKALKLKKIGGAALDVYEEEGNYFFNDWSEDIITDDILARLMTFPNVIITAHQGYLTDDALKAIAMTTLQNVWHFENKDTLDNIIFAS